MCRIYLKLDRRHVPAPFSYRVIRCQLHKVKGINRISACFWLLKFFKYAILINPKDL